MRTVFGVLVLGVAAILTAGALRAAGWLPWMGIRDSSGAAGRRAAPAHRRQPDRTQDAPRQHAELHAPADLRRVRAGRLVPRRSPAMPEIVAHGRRPDVRACGLCHYPNGKGRQENAGVSGLPVSYFIQTMNDFRNGVRKSAEPRKANTNLMIAIAKAMTPEEIKAVGRVLRLDEVDAVDPRRRNRPRCRRW